MPYEQETLTKKNFSVDYMANNLFPQVIFHDPPGDTLIKPPLDVFDFIFGNLNLFDLTDVGFDVDNNTIWMSLKTDKGISKTGIYHFRIRSFEGSGVNLIDVKVQNGTANYMILASNSKYSKEPLKVEVEGNEIVIGIPSNLLNSTKYMISVDDMKNNQYIDRTGWYTVNMVG